LSSSAPAKRRSSRMRPKSRTSSARP